MKTINKSGYFRNQSNSMVQFHLKAGFIDLRGGLFMEQWLGRLLHMDVKLHLEGSAKANNHQAASLFNWDLVAKAWRRRPFSRCRPGLRSARSVNTRPECCCSNTVFVSSLLERPRPKHLKDAASQGGESTGVTWRPFSSDAGWVFVWPLTWNTLTWH